MNKEGMILDIQLVEHRAILTLKAGNTIQGQQREFSVDSDLAKNLLVEVDALLSAMSIKPMRIDCVKYSCKNAGLTTERIGQTVADTYNFVLQQECS